MLKQDTDVLVMAIVDTLTCLRQAIFQIIDAILVVAGKFLSWLLLIFHVNDRWIILVVSGVFNYLAHKCF